ncbi:MAG: two-component regulator propeller domain-containing protein, partial [Perlabentimonas sp.]
MRTFIIILLTALSQTLFSLAQEQVNLSPSKRLSQYPIESWSMDEGLPSDMTIKILQDSVGYIWLATYKGIAQFDGVNFTNYNHTSSEAIKSVTIQDITYDKYGNLWFASQRGVVKYSDYSFKSPKQLKELNNISIEAIYYDSTSNNLWLGTTSDGLFRYNFENLEAMKGLLDLSQSVIKSIISDNNGNIWIGTQWGEVIKYDGDSFQLVAANHIMGGIGAFYFTNSTSTLWVAAEQGVFKLEDDKLSIQTNIPIKQANAIIEDKHRTLWIGTDNGLFRYNLRTKKLDSLKEQTGIPNNLIRDIYPDKEGNLWIATYRRGIFKLTDGAVTSFSKTEGLSSNIITTIAQKDSNTFYIGDELGRINILKKNGRISRLNLKNNIAQNRLKNLFIDSKSNLWISTYIGLLKKEPNGRELLLNYESGFPTETIRLVFEDSRKNIWVGTRTMGLFRIKPNGEIIEVLNRDTGLSSNYILHVTEDKLGRIVVSTKNGINIIENYRVLKVINMDSGLPSNFTFNVHIDDENVYWASSNDGIFRIENDQNIFIFNTENGLFDNVLFDILEDEHGYFWVPSDIGIARISKEQLNNFAKGEADEYSYSIYDRSDGMKASRCIGATKSIKTTNGNLAFTTSGGVAFVNPSNIHQDKVLVNPVIEKIIVGEKTFKSNEKIEVLPSNDHISIHFTAFNFKLSKKIAFRYKLSPFDNEWIKSETNRTARYTNLPPGEYTFHVQSSLDKHTWGKTVKASIIVHRSWWQTWWFIASMALFFSMLLFLIYKARTYTVKKQKQELERLVKVRTALIAEQKRELEKQAEELEKLSIVASHTDNAILITSPEGEIQWVNESFTRIYGYTVEEFIEEKHSNLAKVSKDPNIQQIIKESIETHQPTSYTIEVSAKDGEKIWIQTSLTPIKNEAGEVISIVAIDSDITALKKAEQEMINMNDEIVTQAESILQQNEEIQTQRDELEQINTLLIKHTQNIESSIWYAHTIQKAILPTKQSLNQFFETFIVFKPRDIVSG